MSAITTVSSAISKKESMQIEQSNALIEVTVSPKPNNKSRMIKYIILSISVVFIIGLTLLLLYLFHVFDHKFNDHKREDQCLTSCCIYCDGDLLKTIQEFDYFNDSKYFVDMPMNTEPNEILNAWKTNIIDKNLSDNKDIVYQFLTTHFNPAGSDITDCIPIDFNVDDIPQTLRSRIADNKLQTFATSIYKLWQYLCKTINSEVYENPSRHSLLPLDNPQMIVAGGRFREIYYWDTFWILNGLLISNMSISAKITLNNLMNLTATYGHMLNGNRIYYQNRSQPPLLTFMMDLIYTFEDNNDTFIRENIKYLEILKQEYFWWMNGQTVNINKNNNNYTMNLYYINSNKPRPEGFKHDIQMTSLINQSAVSIRHAYSSLRSSAESGWDFSSRWCLHLYCEMDLTNIDTINIIPVELNSYLYHIEITLAKFFTIINATDEAQYFINASIQRSDAIYNVFWNENTKRWHDYDIRNNKQIYENGESSLAQYIPLWLLPYNETIGIDVLTSLNNSGLLYIGGVSTTNVDDKQQWDFPNAWPPLQWIIVQIAKKYNHTEIGQYILRNVTQTYINAAYIGLNKTLFMSEKYNVLNVGGSGHGGEYKSQLGFGWSNGVALSFLYDYGDWLVAPTIH